MPVLAVCVILLAAVMRVVLAPHRLRTLGDRPSARTRAPRDWPASGRPDPLRHLRHERGLRRLCGFLLSASPAAPRSTWATSTCSTSIAVVVIGGTSVAGGYANVPGLWGASLFLFLLVTMLNTFGVGAGVRYLLTGLIIIAVIVAAGSRRALR